MRQQIFSTIEKFLLPAGVAILIFSFLYDAEILRAFAAIRLEPLDNLMLFMTNIGLALLIIALAVALLLKKKYLELALIIITIGISMEIGYLLKKIFQMPRPHAVEILDFTTIAHATGYGFPSLHATFCFSLLPFIQKIFSRKLLRVISWSALFIIAVSRIYVGVHFASDVIGGALIGFLAAKICMHLQQKHHIIEWFIFHIKDKFELRRQMAHMLTGIVIVVLLKYNYLNAWLLFAILVVGGITVLLSRKYRIPVIHQMLKFFERPKDLKYFPGKGSFFLILGSLLTVIIFPKDIAMAAIAIMAVGDAITTVIGTYFGRIKNPLNPGKHLEGTILAIILSTLAAFTFVPFEKAFLASAAGMLFESLTVRFLGRIIDDNLLIPLVAGIVMILVS